MNGPTDEPIIKIRKATKRFGKVHALKSVDLDIYPGEVIVIVGPSGSGKSTLLRCINRLESIDEGDIWVDNIHLTDRKTDINKVREEIGMVFQQFNLFPNYTVLGNIMLAQKVVRNRDNAEAERIARALLERVGIPEKADVYPSKLSGGAAAARRHRPRPGDAAQDHAL